MFPSGLSSVERVRLVQDFAATHFIPFGIGVDINVVWATAKNGEMECYAHALLLSRTLSGDVMGKKRLESNGWGAAEKWREHWVSLLNKAYVDAGRAERVSYWPAPAFGRGLDLPGRTVGVGCDVDAREISWRNGERIIADPGLAVDWLVREKSTFTREDLATFVKERTAGPEQYSKALARVESSVEIVRVGKDAFGEERYSKRGAQGVASSFDVSADEASGGSGGEVSECSTPEAIGASGTLREAADVWEAAGFRLRGVGLTYEEAKAFERRLKVKSVGVKGLFQRWMKKRDRLEGRDVLIVNDAATLTRRQKEWMLAAARAVKAKLVLVDGDRFKVIDGARIGLDFEEFEMLAAE
jgi:hypothetical protein